MVLQIYFLSSNLLLKRLLTGRLFIGCLLTCFEMPLLQLVSGLLYCHPYKQIDTFSFPIMVTIYEFYFFLTQ